MFASEFPSISDEPNMGWTYKTEAPFYLFEVFVVQQITCFQTKGKAEGN